MTLTPSTVSREAGTSKPARRSARRRLSASHILLGVAVVLAFGLNLLALQDRSATTMVAVADGPAAAGTALSPAQLRLVPVASDFDGLSSLVTEAELQSVDGWVLRQSLSQDDLLTASMLVEPGLSSGLRSMSIPIDITHAAGGSIVPGDVVDVISVEAGSAVFVATGVEVVAVADSEGGTIGSLGGYHVVLAVGADQALALAEALDSGSLELVRSTGASAVDVGVGVDDS